MNPKPKTFKDVQQIMKSDLGDKGSRKEQMNATGSMESETDATKIRIRVAELCGWKVWYGLHDRVIRDWASKGAETIKLPDYCNDLNAMHEAENTLSFSSRQRYYHKLREFHPATTAGFQIADIGLVRSSALARAKAFVATLEAPSVLEPNDKH